MNSIRWAEPQAHGSSRHVKPDPQPETGDADPDDARAFGAYVTHERFALSQPEIAWTGAQEQPYHALARTTRSPAHVPLAAGSRTHVPLTPGNRSRAFA